jgi:hypothetical protein
MPLVALLLLLWALFGCAVVILMIYGVFEHVAMNEPVTAAVLATCTAFLASLGSVLSWWHIRLAVPNSSKVQLGRPPHA